MKDTLIVTRWEFLRSIRSKAFLITTIMVPLIMIVAAVIPQLLIKTTKKNLKIVDDTGAIYMQLSESLKPLGITTEQIDLIQSEVKDEAAQDKNKSVRYLFIPGDFFTTKEAFFYSRSADSTDESTVQIQMILDQLTHVFELQKLGLSSEQITQLQQKVQVTTVPLDDRANNMTDLIVKQAGLIGLTFLVIFASMMAGGILLQGIISEKNDRVVEVLLSSVTSKNLMAGKIFGTCLLGLIQMLIFGALGVGVVTLVFKVSMAALLGTNLLYLVVYSLLAFVQIITLYALLGSIMKDAQSGGQSQPLVAILPVIPMWFFAPIMSNPSGAIALVLSYFPPCTSLTMLMRIAMGSVSGLEIALTMLELAVFDVFMVYFVARVFKTGLLMYGKGAGFREAWRWFRQATD